MNTYVQKNDPYAAPATPGEERAQELADAYMVEGKLFDEVRDLERTLEGRHKELLAIQAEIKERWREVGGRRNTPKAFRDRVLDIINDLERRELALDRG